MDNDWGIESRAETFTGGFLYLLASGCVRGLSIGEVSTQYKDKDDNHVKDNDDNVLQALNPVVFIPSSHSLPLEI